MKNYRPPTWILKDGWYHQVENRPLPTAEDMMIHLGGGKFCTLKQFPQKLKEMEQMTADLIRKAIRRAMGKVD